MDKFKYLQLKTIDESLKKASPDAIPANGWISSIRGAIGMSMQQLGERIGVTRQAISDIEISEKSQTISLKTLEKVAEGLDCRLVYSFVPKSGSLEKMVKNRGYDKAKKMIVDTNQSMLLEDQATGNMKSKIDELAKELMDKLDKDLWKD